MLRGFGIVFTLVAALLCGPGEPNALAADPPDVRLPPNTRQTTTDPNEYTSGRGLRDSTDFIAKELARRGIAVDQIGPYRVRGVELTRFVSRSATTPWLAVQVLRVGGKTVIFFVPRPKA